MDDFAYADPATLAGLLQRGRGLGAQQATAADADPIYACVINDSRWDRQTESRSAYLTRLISRLELPLAPLERHLFAYTDADADALEPVLEVLATLPLVGRTDAVRLLRRYAVEGLHWASAVEQIANGHDAYWSDLGAEVVAAHTDDELHEHAWDVEPWRSWAEEQPRLREILGPAETVSFSRVTLRDFADLSTDDLVERVKGDGVQDRRYSLQELGRRLDPVVFAFAEDTSIRNADGWVPGLSEALEYFGTAAVPRARGWEGSADGLLDELAVRVLAGFGDAQDIPFLLRSFVALVEEECWRATETPAAGLGRLRAVAAAPTLIHAWETTPHPRARVAFLEGLRGCAPEAAEEFLVEGLDDSEPEVQELACAYAPETAYVRRRLGELAADPLDAEVRGAAAQRLRQS